VKVGSIAYRSDQDSPITEGRVVQSLNGLSNSIYRLERMLDELHDLIRNPEPIPGSLDCTCSESLIDRIKLLNERSDDAAIKLESVINIIRYNLSGIKLD